MRANILPLYTPSTPGQGQRVIFVSLLKVVMLHIKLKRKKSRPTCKLNIDLTHTPDLWGFVERSDIDIVQISMFIIKLSTKTYLVGYRYHLNDIHGELRV